MAHCSRDSDCRQSDGYTCSDPTQPPWNAAILDDNQSQGVCLVAPGLLNDATPQYDAAVCAVSVPDGGASEFDAADAALEGGDASESEEEDAARDASLDGGLDSGDAGDDGGVASRSDASDGGSDAPSDTSVDAPVDTGSADAPGGG